ncbi:MAG: PEP/pyruvate-binding domain-containing protein [candidate division Zixibacteria bacterium]|nr:PEP/pyruvate-binding domain-containing protein [candidate division Zixibacteria bacterium]
MSFHEELPLLSTDLLRARAQQLNCLYAVEELFNLPGNDEARVIRRLIELVPQGWRFPEHCRVRIAFDRQVFLSPDFGESAWVMTEKVRSKGRALGTISVYYARELPLADEGPFLDSEVRLLKIVAKRLGHFLEYNRMQEIFTGERAEQAEYGAGEWKTILEVLRNTNRNLYLRIVNHLLYHLCWNGEKDAQELLHDTSLEQRTDVEDTLKDPNRPYLSRSNELPPGMDDRILEIAGDTMDQEDLLKKIRKWIREDKLSFQVQILNRNLPLSEVGEAVRRYYNLMPDKMDLNLPAIKGITVSLIRRFLSDQLHYINVAKRHVHVGDFSELLRRLVFSTQSHGKLGGKSAGLYLASQILAKKAEQNAHIGRVKVPRTWHITSDMLLHFMHFNDLDEIVEQKYKPISQVRFEYPHVVQSFKNATFPPETIQGLSMALDELGGHPLIVRSSSLLEDSLGAAFSGKYKSLFLANQGSKKQRLSALLDAVAEVYASTFGPDPIEYRAERGLLDYGEEMGIMIQEVVGTRVGDYFLPTFAGVAFSRNEFRWSPRIKREDGLVRLVPGLGTRAVDRLSDDYPILLAPGQPGLRVNVTPQDIARYSPQKIDVINMRKNTFETVGIRQLLREFGYQIPRASQLVSIYQDGHIRKPQGAMVDFDEDDLVVTFEGLITNTPFIEQVQAMLSVLEEELETPVDIEFAHDGKDLYLLQCRPQSYDESAIPAEIPTDIPDEDLLFSANRYVSNGRIPDVTHIVYIDPEAYARLSTREDLLAVGQAVGRLNQILPKRQFVLMGPGRWGSRGDIKLGVNVTYSHINNTSMLIEVARKKGNYVPDLSFGTHFFQDLVEAQIRYLPLYPDDKGAVFNEAFFTDSPNVFADVVPELASLAETVRVIDVARATGGQVLKILMNAELDRAVGVLGEPSTVTERSSAQPRVVHHERRADNFWRWRLLMAEQIAARMDADELGVKAVYLFGSVKNATAHAQSDINLLVNFSGTPEQLMKLHQWLKGWSLCLDELNKLRTGYRSGGLLDVHIISDDDIAARTGYAAKIGAATDAARELPMGSGRDR